MNHKSMHTHTHTYTCRSDSRWSRWVLHSFSNSSWWVQFFQRFAGMYKNQLQELAQRSCFNLPSYACIREGPDHAPRFKASVNFNGEIFEGPSYCTTLRQAEHAAAEVALNTLSTRGPCSRSLAARVLDETGVYKNLLQETAHRAGLNLPVYTTMRSGPGHLPIFTSTVELAAMNFTGDPGKTKKQAEKNAAMVAWSALKRIPNLGSSSQTNKDSEGSEEQEQVVVTTVLSNFRPKDENKAAKQKEQSQSRRRVVPCYRDNNNGSSSQLRSTDLLSDFSSIYPTQRQNQNCYSALSPPIASKIFEAKSARENKASSHPSNRAIPVEVRNRSQVNMKEVPPPLEEHQKDEEEWLNVKSGITEKHIDEKGPNNDNSGGFFRQRPSYQRTNYCGGQRTQMRTSTFGPVSAPIAAAPTGTVTRAAPCLPSILSSGRIHTQGLAPAVHIRTVIPVCAAPPARPPSSNPSTLQMKEAPKSHQSSAADCAQPVEEFSTASLELNRLQL